jgi:Domain of unknown function (DUF4865)
MLVMHYRIALGGDPIEAVAAIRKRVAERGALFDGMPGLERKFFLLDPVDPTYATLYLWREPEAALAFLQGPFFATVIASFGRPAVRLLLPTAVELPAALPRSVTLSNEAQGVLSGPHVQAIDPLDGSDFTLSFAEASRGRRFELLYTTRSRLSVAA